MRAGQRYGHACAEPRRAMILVVLPWGWLGDDRWGRFTCSRCALQRTGVPRVGLVGKTCTTARLLGAAEAAITGPVRAASPPSGECATSADVATRGVALPVPISVTLTVDIPILAPDADLRAMGEANAMDSRLRAPVRAILAAGRFTR